MPRLVYARWIISKPVVHPCWGLYGTPELGLLRSTVWGRSLLESLNQEQASTDGLSSICSPVHLRPHFYISNGPSPEYVHEIDGLSSSTVCLRPSRTNNQGLSSEFVHEVDSRSSFWKNRAYYRSIIEARRSSSHQSAAVICTPLFSC